MYRTFTRTWWKENPKWPNGLEPCIGASHYQARFYSEDDARRFCEEYNATHEAGRLSRKCEYEEV